MRACDCDEIHAYTIYLQSEWAVLILCYLWCIYRPDKVKDVGSSIMLSVVVWQLLKERRTEYIQFLVVFALFPSHISPFPFLIHGKNYVVFILVKFILALKSFVVTCFGYYLKEILHGKEIKINILSPWQQLYKNPNVILIHQDQGLVFLSLPTYPPPSTTTITTQCLGAIKGPNGPSH